MSEMQLGLLITAIGMGLVFAVIIFLWGMMALMMRLTSGRKKVNDEVELLAETDEPLVPVMQIAEGQRRAATAAVAVALMIDTAQKKDKQKRSAAQSDGDLSPWQAIHRARQLNQRTTRG